MGLVGRTDHDASREVGPKLDDEHIQERALIEVAIDSNHEDHERTDGGKQSLQRWAGLTDQDEGVLANEEGSQIEEVDRTTVLASGSQASCDGDQSVADGSQGELAHLGVVRHGEQRVVCCLLSAVSRAKLEGKDLLSFRVDSSAWFRNEGRCMAPSRRTLRSGKCSY